MVMTVLGYLHVVVGLLQPVVAGLVQVQKLSVRV